MRVGTLLTFSMSDWSNEVTLKFLEFYESERLLWDSKDENHKMKHKVHDAWRRISVNMGDVSIEELKGGKGHSWPHLDLY